VETKKVRLLWGMTVFTCGLSLIGATPLTAQGNCQPVDDALSKVMTTPTHVYSTMNAVPNAGDKLHTYETIYAGGSVYTKVGGKWTRGPWTLQQVMKQEQENRQKSKYTCRYLRDESVNGETAAVYSTHSERSDEDLGQMKSDGQVWISKSKGLPLRQEFDIESGGSGKQHHSARYEYTNVQPPL
jgi:hypothetical protein